MTNKTINRKISTLKTFFRYLVKHQYISSNPTTHLLGLKINKPIVAFVPHQQMVELQNKMKEMPQDDWQHKTADLLLELLYATGLRVSEITFLTQENINESRAELKIIGKGNKQRIIPIKPYLLKKIQDYQEQKKQQFNIVNKNIWCTNTGKDIYVKYVYRIVNKYLSMVSSLKKNSPHVLRHSFATSLLNNGADINVVKSLLGHSSLAATQIYTHTNINELKNVYAQAHPNHLNTN